MKIAIDLTPLYGRKHTGMEYYAIDLYKALITTGHQIVPIFHVENTVDDNRGAYVIDKTPRIVLENWKLVCAVKAIQADIVLFPIFPPPVHIDGGRSKIVPVVHDWAYLKFRDTLNTSARYYLTPKMNRALRRADAIITISETMKREAGEMISRPVYNCGENISSDYKDCSSKVSLEYLKKWNLKKEGYIISVSTIEPRKNFKFLLKVFKPMLKERGMKLVLVGRKGWGKDAELQKLITEMDDLLIFTEYVSLECLMSLYRFAYAFSLLSLYEGFGRTPFDAVACGCRRIVLSDIPIFRETFNNHALFLPLDAESLCISSLMDGFIPLVGRDFKIPFNVMANRVSLFLRDIERWQNRDKK